MCTRGGQKTEFGLRGGRLGMFFADAESKNFLCRWRRSGGGDIFFQATCLYVTIAFAILRSQGGVGVEYFYDLRRRAEQNSFESERTRSQKNETPSISDVYHSLLEAPLDLEALGLSLNILLVNPALLSFYVIIRK